MAGSITHAKSVSITDWTQAQLDEQIALGFYPLGTTLSNIALPSDWNAGHSITGLAQSPASSANGQVATFGATSDQLATAAFLGGINTTAPNATIPVAYYTAYDTGYADIDLAVVPKGTGAFMLTVPDGTAAGGNKRGQNAVDLQTSRGNATQVASGSFSFVAGRNCTAVGTSGISLGDNNLGSANYDVLIGRQLTASLSSTVLIGATISATKSFTFAIGSQLTLTGQSVGSFGYSHNLAGAYSFAFGSYCTTTAAASYTAIMGTFVKSSASGGFVFGKGVNSGSPLDNNVANSVWLAANSTVPGIAIWDGGGVGGFGKVSIGSATAPTDDCLFEVVSTTKGSRPIPKMTQAQRNAIVTPSAGMLVYNTDTSALNIYTTSWGAVGGAGSVNIKQTEIDFGSSDVDGMEFTIADGDVTGASQLTGTVAYEAPTGKEVDELQLDGLDLKFGPGSGQFTLYATALEGVVSGKFKINYLIG